MKHFLLTRINTETDVWGSRGSRKLARFRFDEDYLQHRVDVFERYTIPSVEQQACRDFTWLVFIHRDTGVDIKKKFGDRVDNLVEIASDTEIPDIVQCAGEEVITTNLDSDDLIASDYIESIQREYSTTLNDAPRPVVLSFPLGFKLSEPNQVLVGTYFVNNPFASLINREGETLAVSSYNHGVLDQYFPVVVADRVYMWITVVHSKNIANSLKRDSRESSLLNVCDIYNESVSEKLAPYYSTLRRFKLVVSD